MKRYTALFASLFLAGTLTATSPAAAATCTVPNTITNGQVADATKIMGDFTAVANCAQQGITTTGSPTTGSIPVFSSSQTIATGNLTGDVTTSGGTATILSNSGVTAGSYINATLTIDGKGRVTSAASGSTGSGSGSGTYWGHAQAGVSGIKQVTATVTSGSAVDTPNNGLFPFPQNIWYWADGNTSAVITFDLGESQIISGIAFFQNNANSQGMWQVSASQDNTTYTNIGSPGAWGGDLRSAIVFANNVAYRYWRVSQISGTTNQSPWQQMIMFRWGPHS